MSLYNRLNDLEEIADELIRPDTPLGIVLYNPDLPDDKQSFKIDFLNSDKKVTVDGKGLDRLGEKYGVRFIELDSPQMAN